MHRLLSLLILALLATPPPNWAGEDTCSPLLNHKVRTLDGERFEHLCQAWQDKVVLVVNTASYCGYTYQYAGLEALYRTYRDQGLVVAGFPSNDFGSQEPGTAQEIREFCTLTYGVMFPMYEKVHAAEGQAHPLFQQLAAAAGGFPRWNFHKYLVDRGGRVVASWSGRTEPLSREVVAKVEEALRR